MNSFFRNMLFLIVVLLFISCKTTTDKRENKSNEVSPVLYTENIDSSGNFQDSVVSDIDAPIIETKIYGDTIWMHNIGEQVWMDTLSCDDVSVFVSVWIDTTDLLIDTVKTIKGSRIVVGFNHYYKLNFVSTSKIPLFGVNFNKKANLKHVLGETDTWLESNLNVFEKLHYNDLFDKYIIEFEINSGDQLSSLYYIIIDAEGGIEYTGTANNWGGGGPDGEPFVSQDQLLYISCSEIYNFMTGTAISISEFASMALYRTSKGESFEFQQIHGIRNIGSKYFLVVFNRYHNKPEFNALVIGTDSLLYQRFMYYGLIEEMDAILLYQYLDSLERGYLYDGELERLLSIKIEQDSVILDEYNINQLPELHIDSSRLADFELINFGYYSSNEFCYSNSDSLIYRLKSD